jgi:hypothetical protein
MEKSKFLKAFFICIEHYLRKAEMLHGTSMTSFTMFYLEIIIIKLNKKSNISIEEMIFFYGILRVDINNKWF